MTLPAATMDPTETMVGTANDVGLWIAPEGTAPPAAGAAFASPWKPLGYASDDGPTLAGDTTSESFTPWQSIVPIRTVITERSLTAQFVLWQLNETTLALYFDVDPPTPAAGGDLDFDVRSDQGGHIYSLAVDGMDGDNTFRISFTRATLDSVGDMQLQRGAMVPLDVTLTALDDNGVLAHVSLHNGAGAVTAEVTTTEAQPADQTVDATSGSESAQ